MRLSIDRDSGSGRWFWPANPISSLIGHHKRRSHFFSIFSHDGWDGEEASRLRLDWVCLGRSRWSSCQLQSRNGNWLCLIAVSGTVCACGAHCMIFGSLYCDAKVWMNFFVALFTHSRSTEDDELLEKAQAGVEAKSGCLSSSLAFFDAVAFVITSTAPPWVEKQGDPRTKTRERRADVLLGWLLRLLLCASLCTACQKQQMRLVKYAAAVLGN